MSNIVPDEYREKQVVHRILSPTDCIKDRLASYIHANARECIDQAVLVADRHPFNKSAVKSWCERAPQAYAHFIRSLRAAKKSQNTIETRASRQGRLKRS